MVSFIPVKHGDHHQMNHSTEDKFGTVGRISPQATANVASWLQYFVTYYVIAKRSTVTTPSWCTHGLLVRFKHILTDS